VTPLKELEARQTARVLELHGAHQTLTTKILFGILAWTKDGEDSGTYPERLGAEIGLLDFLAEEITRIGRLEGEAGLSEFAQGPIE
jgi:hypothetical protein